MARQKMGLVLEGGAMRGLYTAGVLDVFLEQAGEIFVIRPDRPLEIGRMSHDPAEIQEAYDRGRADALACLERMKQWLEI